MSISSNRNSKFVIVDYNDDVLEIALAILKQRNELRRVECRLESGTLVLTGFVDSFYHKQIAFHSLLGKVNGTSINTSGLKVKNNS